MKILAMFVLASLILATYVTGRLFRSGGFDSFCYGKKDLPDDIDDA